MRLLIAYATRHGHTARVVERLAAAARAAGADVTVRDLGTAERRAPLPPLDAVLVAAPVYIGRHPGPVRRWVRAHRAELARVPTAFVSVSWSAGAARPEQRADAARYAERFLRGAGWRPALVRPVGGALPYTRYDPGTRWVMRTLTRRAGGDWDTTRDFEYTDWAAVDRLAGELLALARRDVPAAPPVPG